MSSLEHKQKIWNLIQDIEVGMLTTHDQGELRSRPMHLVQDDYDGTLWFYTDTESDKVFEIEKDHDVCITFEDHPHEVYVSMTGKARLTNDKALIEKYWNPFVAAWFPDGKDSPNVGIIEIKINSGEHWDGINSRAIQAFKMLKANVTEEKPDMGENQRFG
jgi:general stress protein 26